VKTTQRLDKILAHMGIGSRTEIRKLARSGAVTVNGKPVRDSGLQVDPYNDRIEVQGDPVQFREFVYIQLNKPQGVVSATEDNRDRTVLDLLDRKLRAFEPFPVGRLDKDTEGLLLLTNDGKLAHELLSPRHHVPKTYFAEVEGLVDEAEVEAFAGGVVLDDGYLTLPARLVVLGQGERPGTSRIELTLTEGKFHQVKRMFEAVGKRVLFLKRLSMGSLVLDKTLRPGEYRELTEQELNGLLSSRP